LGHLRGDGYPARPPVPGRRPAGTDAREEPTMTRGTVDHVTVRGGARPALAALLLLGGLVAGCGGGSGDEAGGSTTSSPASASPSSAGPSASSSSHDGDGNGHDGDGHDGGTAQPPFPANTQPDT